MAPPARTRPALAALALALAAPGAAVAGPVEALPPPNPRGVTEVAPGIGYQRLERDGGQVVHVLRAAPSPRVTLAPALAGDSPIRRGALTRAIGARMNAGAVAGVNGDFFSYATSSPSGVFMQAGELVREPEASRSALVLLGDGNIEAVALALQGRYQPLDPATGAAAAPPRAFTGVNRAPARNGETTLFTSAYGAVATPKAASRYEVRVRLDADVPLRVGQPVGGTVIASGSGGGTTIGAGHMVLSAAGSAGPGLVRELPTGRRVAVAPGLLSLPPGALHAVGGGPALVRNGIPIVDAGEGFSSAQTGGRTSRSAVAQHSDGTRMFVTAEGPVQGSPGLTVAEQAQLMRSLGARTAIAMDGGGSAQLALWDDLVIPWSGPRSIASAVLMNYDGVTVRPLPFRLSANNDHVDDRATMIVRATRPGVTRVTVARKSGRPTRRIWEGRMGPGAVALRLDPRRLRLGDGVYVVVARHEADDGSGVTEQRRRVIFDRTLSSLTARPSQARRGRVVRQRLRMGFRLQRAARVTVRVRSTSGRRITTLVSGRLMRPGARVVDWDRRVRNRPVTGRVEVTVEARTRFGTSGLVRAVTLTAPPGDPRAAAGAPGA
ncbi:phosphodiester glycosidase family protein [Miltoncostaea marina]|uniref:phosphodiester glycosidase family protein n=1 Tax=Miltoncostaea marina TaxID=2843215 RepID=UPI001C3E245F|nr:phosphodiester glycosidase family protein [Miltoncostaea marina]